MNKIIRLTESDLRGIVSRAVGMVLKESSDEFMYSDEAPMSGRGRHRQTIIYKGQEVGYLVTKEKGNPFSMIEEIYMLPDVDYGIRDGWIDFVRFADYDEALSYARANFDELVRLFSEGDYD